MRTLLEDARYAARMLRKHPGYAAITILTLAVGIGINTTTYSVAEVLLFQPLLLPGFDRCVAVYGVIRGTSDRNEELSTADWFDLRRDIRSLQSFSALRYSQLNLTGAGEPVPLQGFAVSAEFFDALAGRAILGRVLLPSEDEPGKDRVVVLSHALWVAHFGADPHVVGRLIQLGGRQYHVVGVMQREFRYPPVSQYWIPLALSSEERADRRTRRFGAIGRLRPGVSLRQATAELETLAARLERQFPVNDRFSARAALLREEISGELTARYMRMMLGATLFVLLIACANIANLQFARISLRAKEIAVRAALGSGRFRVVRLLLVESVVVALCGGALGICVALWGMALTKSYMSPEVQRYLPGWERISLDRGALLFTVALAAAAGIVSGIVPAFLGSAALPGEALREGGRSSSGGRGRARLRAVLVVAEIAVSLTLLVGAGLLIKGIRQVDAPRPSMLPERVLTFRVFLREGVYSGTQAAGDFHRRALDAVAALPGVEAVALVSDLPFSGGSHGTPFTIEGDAPPTPSQQPNAQRQCISPNYFAAARIPIVAGRGLSESDGADAPPVAVVSQRLVKRYFADKNPIGKKIRLAASGAGGPLVTIVGVAADLLHEPFDRLPRIAIYRPFLQSPERGAHYLARVASSVDPLRLAPAVRTQIASIDRDQPVADMMTWRKVMNDQLLGYRYVVGITTICGLLALGLATIGVYGILSFAVSERAHEIGVRMALGAGAGQILLLISRWGLQLTAAGVILGLAATLGLARLLSGLLFGVGAFDAAAFTAGVAALVLAAMLACCVPAWRAISVNPVVTLRQG